ncbi:aryl-sulfate sulfotransferase [Chitinispirillales bacterium ANBcel5]|uniref:aryl-sulfate sulfotransferase n=1 Tax=Cellulosispirillum alkaliphilum TaxID=3039283 RepID=UPI002A51F84E|nr:aryl-sulfate sulfotransferase [Chitinispirillales bacterium ANBcel5]
MCHIKQKSMWGIFFILLFTNTYASEVEPGYVLYTSALGATTTYLMNMEKEVVHTWTHPRSGGYSVHLLENGNLLRPMEAPQGPGLNGAAASGVIQEIDPDGNIVWEFEYRTDDFVLHHNLVPMPNGNILAVAYERIPGAEAEQAGINVRAIDMWNRQILSEKIIEIDPTAPAGSEIVWQWRLFDHLVRQENAADHPTLFSTDLGMDGNRFPGFNDWMHLNGLSYCPVNDQVIFSSRYFSEIYVIDKSTTTEEAATGSGGRTGMGGRILYRWGNPQNYGAPGEKQLDVVHSPKFIPPGYPGEGNIILFENGVDRRQSQILEITPPVRDDGTYEYNEHTGFGPGEPEWVYTKSGFHSPLMSSVQRLKCGNTFTCESEPGRMREIAPDGTVLWEYEFGQMVSRVLKYPVDYSGIITLLDLEPIPDDNDSIPNDVDTIPDNRDTIPIKATQLQRSAINAPSIARKSGRIEFSNIKNMNVSIHSLSGKLIYSTSASNEVHTVLTNSFSEGLYITSITDREGRIIASGRITLIH